MTSYFTVCSECKHFFKDVFDGNYCEAFPSGKGIPKAMIYKGNKHDKPFPGDHGIQFEKGKAIAGKVAWKRYLKKIKKKGENTKRKERSNIMPELVETLDKLIENVKEYQKAVREHGSKITPGKVHDWYYIPSLNMVGASKFIGYKDMTAERYEESGLDGRETEHHLRGKKWFDPLPDGELYNQARSSAESLSKTGKLYSKAKFYALKTAYRQAVKSK